MGFWDHAIEASSGTATASDFESAAYRLLAEQVIYDADRSSRVAYSLIRDFEREFRRALEPLGFALKVNSNLRYACAIPQHAKSATASVEQTLLALVLRRIYDEQARSGHCDENGEVTYDLIDLGTYYKQATNGRDMPMVGPLRTLMKTMQRWGIARIVDTDEAAASRSNQPFFVVIRPGIADVLGEAALQRLALFAQADPDDGAAHADAEAEPGEEGGEGEGDTAPASDADDAMTQGEAA